MYITYLPLNTRPSLLFPFHNKHGANYQRKCSSSFLTLIRVVSVCRSEQICRKFDRFLLRNLIDKEVNLSVRLIVYDNYAARFRKDRTPKTGWNLDSWMVITGLFSNGPFAQRPGLWQFTISISIPMIISSLIFLRTCCSQILTLLDGIDREDFFSISSICCNFSRSSIVMDAPVVASSDIRRAFLAAALLLGWSSAFDSCICRGTMLQCATLLHPGRRELTENADAVAIPTRSTPTRIVIAWRAFI